jgi:hypothetical protein
MVFMMAPNEWGRNAAPEAEEAMGAAMFEGDPSAF